MGRGLLFFVQSGDTEMLFYHSLVRGLDINAVYYSSYLIFALSILLLHHFEHSVFRDTRLKYVALAILMVFFTLLSSKSLLVLFIVFVLPIAFYQKQKKGLISKRQVLAIAGLVALAIIYVAVSDNPIKKRYLEITTNNEIVAESEASKGKEQVFNNLSLRLFLWKMAWNNINEQNLWITGCGIGDIGTLQKQRIEQYEEQTQALQNQPDLSILNLHNMYLQVLMGMGIAGLVVFLTMVFGPLLYLKRISSGYEFLVFIVSYSLYMMQESALQTQAGVIYFSFFYQLLIVNYYSEKSRQLKTAGG